MTYIYTDKEMVMENGGSLDKSNSKLVEGFAEAGETKFREIEGNENDYLIYFGDENKEHRQERFENWEGDIKVWTATRPEGGSYRNTRDNILVAGELGEFKSDGQPHLPDANGSGLIVSFS